MPTKKPLSFDGVHRFLLTLFADDLLALRVLSLAGATVGVIESASLAVAMIGQGLALGGSWDGLPSLLALNAPPHRRGWYAMLGQLGAPLGFFVASGVLCGIRWGLLDRSCIPASPSDR